jgi:hypothetical protein
MDWRTNMVATIAPRFDPDMLATWQEYWAFHDPVSSPGGRNPYP